MSNSITYDAAEHNVHSVTVFQVDSAEVTRRIEIDLEKGQNEINIKNLPSVLDGDSIRVDGIGKAVVFDVVYKAPPRRSSIDLDEHSETEEIVKRKNTIEREQEVVKQQQSILNTYSKSVTSEHAKAENLSDILNTYGTRQLEYGAKLAELDKDLMKINKELKAAREALGKQVQDEKRGARIVVVVLAHEDGPAELSLTYNVTGASWTPLYDLRADIATSEGEKNKSKITLNYRASITQETAEDWNGVHLTLSTASPQLGSTIPKLSAMRIGEDYGYRQFAKRHPRGPTSAFGGGGDQERDKTLERSALIGQDDVFHAIGFKTAVPQIDHAPARISNEAEGFSSTFVVEGLSNIPSDTEDSTESHKVTISAIQLSNVQLEWVTVPKESQTVFLKAYVKNTSEFPFLAGDANVFMNNNFVARSSIPLVSPQESFSISLGADSSIRVTYHPQSKKVQTPTGGFISASRVSTMYEQNITIKNTRGLPLTRLVVKDQIPISTTAEIKIDVHEPALIEIPSHNSGSSKKGNFSVVGSSKKEPTLSAAYKEVAVSGHKDVKARWCRTNEEEDFSEEAAEVGELNRQGFMEWICKVDASSSIDLKLSWEVNVPKGFRTRWH